MIYLLFDVACCRLLGSFACQGVVSVSATPLPNLFSRHRPSSRPNFQSIGHVWRQEGTCPTGGHPSGLADAHRSRARSSASCHVSSTRPREKVGERHGELHPLAQLLRRRLSEPPGGSGPGRPAPAIPLRLFGFSSQEKNPSSSRRSCAAPQRPRLARVFRDGSLGKSSNGNLARKRQTFGWRVSSSQRAQILARGNPRKH